MLFPVKEGVDGVGVYLNDPGVYGLFQEDYSLAYYVDKSEIIRELVPMIELRNFD